jgi:hypothetical protein
MNTDKVNRWLTLGANIGVFFGVILLIIELDLNRDMIRAQTRSEVSAQIAQHLELMGSNPQVASVKRRGDAGEELSADEAEQYFLLFVANKRYWENVHYQYRQGMFDEDEFDAERRAWRRLINNNKSFARHWCPVRQSFSPDFVVELESLLEKDVCDTTR